MTEKPKRTTFRIRLEEMVVTLRNDIAMGRYGPGDFLPSEFQLIEQFRLSKNSVRKGLDKLVEQGLIEKVPRVGTRVVVRPEARPPAAIRLGYHSTMIGQANLHALLDLFHRAHPDMIVQPVPLPQLRLAAEWNDFMRTEPIDVLTVNNQLFERISEFGPVQDVLEPVEKAEGTYPFLFRSFTEEDTLYAQPFVFSPLVLCYNKSHFRQCGLPEPSDSWTWDDVAEASGLLSAKLGSLGFYIHYLSLNRWPLFLLQSNLRFERGADGRLAFDNGRFGAAAAIGAALLAKTGSMSAYLSERDDDAERLFMQQKVSMLVTSYFGLNSLRDTDLEYDIAPLPHSGQASTLLLPIGLGINKHGKQKRAAIAFVDFCLGEEAQLHLRQTTLSVPARIRAAEWRGEDKLNRPSRFFLYRDIVPTFRLHSDMNISGGELERMCEELKLFWAGLEDMDTVCRRIRDNV
ncbi:extracellular solute-binding protein [Paenibacillus mesophilus]|uniref:extracellular solute-binding protein n=1 Tax=Paenibacillus mesophilus TaxID=2582849 RepID=UPI00110E51AD|nr:extracellular solute-binding protein [Paenibacillus mesophilus]TMV47363.1 extracellular solute-binding protein [Paenibacillus mesophilus]